MSDLDGRRVLVVEDEFYLAKDVRDALKPIGASVMGPFRDPEQALAALEREKPDCAVIDINTGAGPDFRLADELQVRGVPFIFYTGYDRAVIPERFAQVTRLEKPVDAARLVDAVREICGPPAPDSILR